MRTDQFVRLFILPEVWRKAEHHQKKKLTFFVYLCLSLIVFVGIRAIHMFFAQPELSHLIALPLTIVFGSIVSLGVLRISGRIDFSGHLLLILLSLVVIVGTLVFKLGTATVITRWIPVFPLVATLLLGVAGGRLWTILSILITVGLHFTYFPGEGSLVGEHLAATAAIILITVVTSAISYFYETMRLENERVLQEKIDSRVSFLKTANEQLRTPALILSEMTNALAKTSLDEDQLSYLETMKKANFSLNDGINQLVDAAKREVNSEATILEPFLISRLLGEVVGFVKVLISSRSSQIGFEIGEGTPSVVVGDEEKIKRILYNLIEGFLQQISNSTVSIQAGPSQDQTQALQFNIQIRSAIPVKFIIEPDTAGYRFALRCIEQVGGRLRTTVEDKSLNFLIEIPLRLPSALEEGKLVKSLRPTNQDRRPKVLLVDDSPESLLILTKILSDLKFNISQSFDGALAVEKFKNEYFDLVIMDLAMPNLDGFSAIHKMRDLELEELRPSTHIIVISGTDSSEDIKKALLVGANDHIAKPIVKRIIVEKISLLASETQVSN